MRHFFELAVPVDLTDTAESLLQALGRENLIDREIFAKMSVHKELTRNIVLFSPSADTVSDVEAETEFAKYKLLPADPILVLAFNKLRPDFSDVYPHWTHWKNAAGVWCVMVFNKKLSTPYSPTTGF